MLANATFLGTMGSIPPELKPRNVQLPIRELVTTTDSTTGLSTQYLKFTEVPGLNVGEVVFAELPPTDSGKEQSLLPDPGHRATCSLLNPDCSLANEDCLGMGQAHLRSLGGKRHISRVYCINCFKLVIEYDKGQSWSPWCYDM